MARKPGRPKKEQPEVNKWAGKTDLKLNLGCGDHIEEGYINIDLNADCDLTLDLEDASLPFGDESVDTIYASHIFEHINNFIPLMNECHRVLKPKGQLNIQVPCYPSPQAFSDPTHVRYFTTESFKYWDKRNDLWKRHEYGIKPFSFYFANLQHGWNLCVELHK